MVTVKVLKAFRYSPDGIAVVEVEKGKAELPSEFVDIAVEQGWIDPPKKGRAAAEVASVADAADDDQPPSDPPAD